MSPRVLNLFPVLASSLLGLFAASSALAQAPPKEWKGGIFRPLEPSGTWLVQGAPGNNLLITPTNPALRDGVDILLPPGTGVPQSVELTLAPYDPIVAANVPIGAEFRVEAFTAAAAGTPGHAVGSLSIVKQPSGLLQYEYDLSGTGATTYTVELWSGPTMVGTYSGVPGGGGGGPFFTPNCTCPSCPASAHCCELGAVYYSNGVWYNAWNCTHRIDFGGNSHNSVERVVVIPEIPPITLGDLERIELRGLARPQFELTDLVLGGFAPIGTNYCAANPNSTGATGYIAALGSPIAANNDLELYAFDLPANVFGFYVVAAGQVFVPNPGGTQGNLCVGPSIGRMVTQIGNTGPGGFYAIPVDLLNLAQPSTTVAVQAGETWNFQFWHRDSNPGVTANFTSGYSILFQ